MDTLVLDQLQELDIQGFEPSEVHDVITNYVCAHCYAQLVEYMIPNDRLSIIVCSECGENIERIGAVTRNTVSIRMEQARREFKTVVANLKDLYPTIQHMVQRRSESENLKALGF